MGAPFGRFYKSFRLHLPHLPHHMCFTGWPKPSLFIGISISGAALIIDGYKPNETKMFLILRLNPLGFVMDCKRQLNSSGCSCTYPCSKKGDCCQCIAYHRRSGELPACYFPADAEREFDRSVKNFIRIYQNRGIAFR